MVPPRSACNQARTHRKSGGVGRLFAGLDGSGAIRRHREMPSAPRAERPTPNVGEDALEVRHEPADVHEEVVNIMQTRIVIEGHHG
jgi:hypothetical protein